MTGHAPALVTHLFAASLCVHTHAGYPAPTDLDVDSRWARLDESRLLRTQEALGAEYGTDVRLQELERDLAVVADVMGEIDGRHPADAERPFYGISAGERRVELQLGVVGHSGVTESTPRGGGPSSLILRW